MRAARRRKSNKALYAELNALAADTAVELPKRGLHSSVILQMCLDRCFSHWAYAIQQVNALGPEMIWYQDARGGWHLNKWFRLESELSKDLERISGLIEQLGLSDRLAQVEEAKALLVGEYMAKVFDALELTPAQKKALRPAMDKHLPVLEGEAVTA